MENIPYLQRMNAIEAIVYPLGTYAKNGDVENVERILRENDDVIEIDMLRQGISMACSSGHFLIFQRLLRLHPDPEPEIACYLTISCSSENLMMSRWIYETYRNVLNADKMTRCFITTCRCIRNTEVLDWLIEVEPNINMREHNYYAFIDACVHNRVESMQWLADHIPELTGNNEAMCRGFRGAAGYQRMDAVRWIYNSSSQNIFETIQIVPFFENACRQSQFNLVQWIHEIIPDILMQVDIPRILQNTSPRIQTWIHELLTNPADDVVNDEVIDTP